MFKTAPEFAEVANSRVLNSKSSVNQNRPPKSTFPPPTAPSSAPVNQKPYSINSSMQVENSFKDPVSSSVNSTAMSSAVMGNTNNNSFVEAGSGHIYAQTRAKLRPTTTIGTVGQFLPGQSPSVYFTYILSLICLCMDLSSVFHFSIVMYSKQVLFIFER